jgi:endonuclease I
MSTFFKTSLFLLVSIICFGQNGSPASPYYNGFNFNQTGINLRNALSALTINKHTKFLSYTPGVWEASRVTDLDSNNTNNVILIYGWENGTDTDVTNDLSRSKFNNGGGNGQWNREHVFAKSLGNPALNESGDSDAGEDAHNLRPSDVQRNSLRSNNKFAIGSGTSGLVTGGWYPGDEWKGDVARIIMYMYLRYGNQCLPKFVGTGSLNSVDSNMSQIFLQWNAEDPVSPIEDARNNFHGNTANTYAQGNRNPFIDNPYLATQIWGGTTAQNRWAILANTNFTSNFETLIYPNPSYNGNFTIYSSTELSSIEVITIDGKLVQKINYSGNNSSNYPIEIKDKGFYLLRLSTNETSLTKKILVN